MYSNLYNKVMAKVNPIKPQSKMQQTKSTLRVKSHTIVDPKKLANKELRKSKSSSQRFGSPNYKSYSPNDPRALIIPAIMKAEKARLERKLFKCESSSSNLSDSLPKYLRLSKVMAKTRKNGGVSFAVDEKSVSDREGFDSSRDTSPKALPSESESSCDLRLDLHSMSESSCGRSSLGTSEIPESPTEDSHVESIVRRRKKEFKDVYLLSMAEKAVQNILEIVVRLEIEQERDRMQIKDPEVRAAAEVRHRRNNEEYVRSRLVQERMKLGTMEAARFAELWEVMKGDKKVFHKGVPYGQWLREKHAKLREERVRMEAKCREKEEAQKLRQAKAREAYEHWQNEMRRKPNPPPFVIYSTEKGTYQYVRAGTFFNSTPWIDILEEERQQQKLAEMADRSRQASLSWRQPPRIIRNSTNHIQSAGICPLKVTSFGADKRAFKQSTYDNIVDFYTDLLRRCQPKKSRPVTALPRDSNHTLALVHGRSQVTMASRSKSASNSKVSALHCKSVSDTTFVKSRSHLSHLCGH